MADLPTACSVIFYQAVEKIYSDIIWIFNYFWAGFLRAYGSFLGCRKVRFYLRHALVGPLSSPARLFCTETELIRGEGWKRTARLLPYFKQLSLMSADWFHLTGAGAEDLWCGAADRFQVFDWTLAHLMSNINSSADTDFIYSLLRDRMHTTKWDPVQSGRLNPNSATSLNRSGLTLIIWPRCHCPVKPKSLF